MATPCSVMLATLAAIACATCAKRDDLGAMRDEGVVLGPYYRQALDDLTRRSERIIARGQALRSPVPGADRAGAQLKAAGQTIGELRKIVGVGSGKSPLDTKLDEATRDGDLDALTRIVEETRAKLAHGIRLTNDRLSDVETWLVEAEASVKLQPPPAERAMLGP